MTTFTKPLVAGVVGLLAWTLSIHIVPVKLDTQPTSLSQCRADETSQQVFQSMVDGIVTNMHNDGTVLSIEISAAWKSLTNDSRLHLYHSLSCLAQHENVAFQILPSQAYMP